MAEQTLPNPLTGAEIIEAVADKLKAKMRTDCYLNANSAYDWFEADISVKLSLHDTGTMVKADHPLKMAHGTPPAEPTSAVERTLEIEAAEPNKVRVETGQPVPTLTRDAAGKEIVKGVRYSRKDAAKVK